MLRRVDHIVEDTLRQLRASSPHIYYFLSNVLLCTKTTHREHTLSSLEPFRLYANMPHPRTPSPQPRLAFASKDPEKVRECCTSPPGQRSPFVPSGSSLALDQLQELWPRERLFTTSRHGLESQGYGASRTTEWRSRLTPDPRSQQSQFSLEIHPESKNRKYIIPRPIPDVTALRSIEPFNFRHSVNAFCNRNRC